MARENMIPLALAGSLRVGRDHASVPQGCAVGTCTAVHAASSIAIAGTDTPVPLRIFAPRGAEFTRFRTEYSLSERTCRALVPIELPPCLRSFGIGLVHCAADTLESSQQMDCVSGWPTFSAGLPRLETLR